MAHECPDCGLTCYCGGDIDDCEWEGTPEQMACRHCVGSGHEDEDPEDDA
jgi:hypothetical protein